MEEVAKKTKKSVLKRQKRDAKKEEAKKWSFFSEVEKRSDFSSQNAAYRWFD